MSLEGQKCDRDGRGGAALAGPSRGNSRRRVHPLSSPRVQRAKFATSRPKEAYPEKQQRTRPPPFVSRFCGHCRLGLFRNRSGKPGNPRNIDRRLVLRGDNSALDTLPNIRAVILDTSRSNEPSRIFLLYFIGRRPLSAQKRCPGPQSAAELGFAA
jgi:hypothetical protein